MKMRILIKFLLCFECTGDEIFEFVDCVVKANQNLSKEVYRRGVKRSQGRKREENMSYGSSSLKFVSLY